MYNLVRIYVLCTMKQSILVFSAILLANLVHGQDPTARVVFTRTKVWHRANPFVENWTLEIVSPGNILTAKIPIYADIPETLMLKVAPTFNGDEFPPMEFSVCDSLSDPMYVKDVIDRIIPKGSFPTKCPIPKNRDYTIFEFECTNKYVVPGMDDGHFFTKLELYLEGGEPMVLAEVEGDVYHDQVPSIPGGPSFGR